MAGEDQIVTLGSVPRGISALVLTRNEELNLPHLLPGLITVSDDVHIVDSGSSDTTLAIARAANAQVHQHSYADHASQLGWALLSLHFKYEWVLIADADNYLSAGLTRWLLKEFRTQPALAAGYYFRHRLYYRGQRIHGFKPFSLRLVARSRARVDPSELVDYRLWISGPVQYVNHDFGEYNRKDDDLETFVQKHFGFARRAALEEVLRNANVLDWTVRPSTTSRVHDQRMLRAKELWRHLPLVARSLAYFGYRYLVRGGFLDGHDGLTYHVTQALVYRLLVDLNIRELRRNLASGGVTITDLASIVRSEDPAL